MGSEPRRSGRANASSSRPSSTGGVICSNAKTDKTDKTDKTAWTVTRDLHVQCETRRRRQGSVLVSPASPVRPVRRGRPRPCVIWVPPPRTPAMCGRPRRVTGRVGLGRCGRRGVERVAEGNGRLCVGGYRVTGEAAAGRRRGRRGGRGGRRGEGGEGGVSLRRRFVAYRRI